MFAFLHANRSRYANLQKELEKNVDLGLDSYLTRIENVYRLVSNKKNRINKERLPKFGSRRNRNSIGSIFYTRKILGHSTNNNNNRILNGEIVIPGTDSKVFIIQYNQCQKLGYYVNRCPNADPNVGVVKTNNFLIDNNYLLDSGGTHLDLKSDCNVKNMCNLSTEEELICKFNKGEIKFSKKGNLLIFNNLECYINKMLRANILALHQLNNLPGAYAK